MTLKKASSLFGKPPTNMAKEKAYDARILRTYDIMESRARHGASSEEIDLRKAELDGGYCPRCNKEWMRVDYDNLFGKGHYHEPKCFCYAYCERCRRHLYVEEAMGLLDKLKGRCPNCWAKLQSYEMKANGPRMGSDDSKETGGEHG